MVLASLFGALLGFFLYNKPPAKIYLGDAGSLFIGSVLSVMPFLISWTNSGGDSLTVPAILLATPILEVVALVVIRSYYKIPFYQGSPHHFSIMLRNKGWSVWRILGGILVLNVFFFGIALMYIFGPASWSVTLLLCAILSGMWYLVVFF